MLQLYPDERFQKKHKVNTQKPERVTARERGKIAPFTHNSQAPGTTPAAAAFSPSPSPSHKP